MAGSEKGSAEGWQPNPQAFQRWLGDRAHLFEPGLDPEPSAKAFAFLALLDAGRPCTYDDLLNLFAERGVFRGRMPIDTLRGAIAKLGTDLAKHGHPYELLSTGSKKRAKYHLAPRKQSVFSSPDSTDRTVLLLDPPAVQPDRIARTVIEKGSLPFSALYFLPRSACYWVAFSSEEAEMRKKYEATAWTDLGVRDRLCPGSDTETLGVISLGPGEGLAEVALLRRIFGKLETGGPERKAGSPDGKPAVKRVHYLAVDSSKVLLLDHIETLRENFAPELKEGRLLCAGVVADIYDGLKGALDRARVELQRRGIIPDKGLFFPVKDCGILVCYFGNNFGNDPRRDMTEIFRIISHTIPNRPLEFLVGVSVQRESDDVYQGNWAEFLLQTPHHLLANMGLLESVAPTDPLKLLEYRVCPEFMVPKGGAELKDRVEKLAAERMTPPEELLRGLDELSSDERLKEREDRLVREQRAAPADLRNESGDPSAERRSRLAKVIELERCPRVTPAPWNALHGIRGRIYEFSYNLAYPLRLAREGGESASGREPRPAGFSILLYSIIKFDMTSLAEGIEKAGLFTVARPKRHLIVDTPNGKREYAVFSAYIGPRPASE